MKKIGVEEIAAAVGVSTGTVDRALHGRPGINEGTRQRVMLAARKMGYEPNLAARALSKRLSKLKIGVCVPREIDFFYDELWAGIHEAIERHRDFGIEFVLRSVREHGSGEEHQLKQLLELGVQGVILSAGDPAKLTPAINAAVDRGVSVLCVSADAPKSKRQGVVCVEPRLSGMLAGELMAALVPKRSSVAVVTGMLTVEDHAGKAAAFQEAFPRYSSGGKVIELVEGHEHVDETVSKVSALLSKHPELKGIYVNTVNCLPVCFVLERLGLSGRVKLLTTDLFKEMLPHFASHTICASIYQWPFDQGRIAVNAMVDHLILNKPLSTETFINPSIVMRSNLQLFREMAGNAPKSSPVDSIKSKVAV